MRAVTGKFGPCLFLAVGTVVAGLMFSPVEGAPKSKRQLIACQQRDACQGHVYIAGDGSGYRVTCDIANVCGGVAGDCRVVAARQPDGSLFKYCACNNNVISCTAGFLDNGAPHRVGEADCAYDGTSCGQGFRCPDLPKCTQDPAGTWVCRCDCKAEVI